MKKKIIIQSVSKSFTEKFKKKHVINNLSLEVSSGEVFGFIGPNGAGKSTMINLVMGFINQDSGTISIGGLSSQSPDSHRSIGYLSEDPRFYSQLTAEEHLFFAGKASGLNNKEIKKRTQTLLSRLQLLHSQKQRVSTFSKGMKQRLGIAMAMIHEPQIYILDEPMSGLDPMGRKLVTDTILDLKMSNKTVFFSSHILNDIESLCDHIAIINKGRILYSGEVTDIETVGDSFENAFVEIIQKDNDSREAA